MDPVGLFNIKDRVVIVTGAAGGMRHAIAAGLAAAQASVVPTDVSATKIESLARELRTRSHAAVV
jgi:NADP-dependent 3-hydroxy acid dehydrogenase YdfG